MSEPSADLDPFEILIDEFLDKHRGGERPSLTQFVGEHPDHAERLRSLIPAMLAMEELGLESEAGPPSGRSAALARMPQRLGDYVLIRPVGSGGMGVVYEAVQESLGRHVALKTITFQHPSDTTGLERFRREALAAARLQHAHIVPVYGLGEHDGLHFFTMQFIDGLGLDLVLREVRRQRRKPIAADPPTDQELSSGLARDLYHGRFHPQSTPVADSASEARSETPIAPIVRTSPSPRIEARYFDSVAWLGVQVAEALEYAHRQGVLHRDIKPSNLLMDANGHVWVTDFGLAKIQDGDELTRTGDVVGTLRYMAPERFSGWSDPRSDVFALGATLYELLTFRPAFDEPDRVRLIDRLLNGSPTPPRHLDRRFPRDLETIVMKALANTPGERYATAGQLAEDLRRFVAGRPILARRSGRIERSWRWCRRNPAGAGAAVVVAAALATAATTSMIYAYEQGRAAREVQGLADALSNERESLREALAEQVRAAREIQELADAQTKVRESLHVSLAATQRLLARQDFDRGQAAFEKEEIAAGLLWTLESWRSARDAADLDWQHLALANVSAWSERFPRLKSLLSHEGPVDAAAFSPDGKTILTGGDDRTARFWDADTARPIGEPLQFPGAVQSVAISPNGETALISGSDGAARFWDVAARRPVGPPLTHKSGILCVAFSPDGKMVATSGADKTARLWNAWTGEPIGAPLASQRPVTAVAFDPGGAMIATVSRDATAQLWNTSDGGPIGGPLEHTTELLSVAFRPDGKILVTGGWGGRVRVWDTTTGQPINSEPNLHRGYVRGIAFSPDGKTYATASEDKTARLWDAATHRSIGPPLIHQGPVVAVAFRADSRALLTASSDHTVRVWDAESCRHRRPAMEKPLAGETVAFLRDGRTFLAAGAGPARIWDAASAGQVGGGMPSLGRVRSVAVSPDGKTLVVGGSPAQLWDAATRKPIGQPLWHPQGADVVAFSPDGKTVATGGADRTTRLWDAATGQPIGEPAVHPGSVDALTFQADGRALIVGLDAGAAQAWDVTTRKSLGPILQHPGAVSTVAVSPDGRSIVTGCEDGMARIWNAATGELLAPPLPHLAWVFAVAFSPDGKSVATGSRDRTARIWDAATGQPIGPAFRHAHDVWCVSFAPDGSSLLTGDIAGTARIFPIARELPDDLEQAAARVEVLTGVRLDAARRSIQSLDNATWRTARDQLRESGAPGFEIRH
ncbi:serine/threonine-protein kinase [Paludisphaera borealis]|uniref:Serine/threonine-protein kinase PknB n=1 Tax=Paludisphaera borealis TaxID=1387353 RepID=A0A1U7CUB5_9BACT|nr:serine/threonine-protein kinase [Paludisphaera borealis]APW62489.1 Serine/threonine-protein kinase PknB [Paludisphaera borealis]